MKTLHTIIVGTLTGLVILIYWLGNITEGVYYKSYSPDGQYSRYASKYKYFYFHFPFNGKSAGKVYVYDELTNKLVGSSSLTMISNIYKTDWNEESLTQKGHFSIKLPRKINAKNIDEYKKSVPLKYTWNLYLNGNQYTVNKKQNRLTVSDKNGKVLLQNIQYIAQINNGFQVLNNETEIAYYDERLNKLENTPQPIIKCYEVCGNVPTYGLKITEENNYYIITKAVGFTNYDFDKYKTIDSINKTKVKDIYFLNKKRELTYNDNRQEQEIVVINFETYFGIWSDKYGIAYFDTIDLKSTPIKVMRNKLYGYYNITSTTYLSLEPFKYNLAKFEKINPNGKKINGYIDQEGNEFYKQ